MAAIITRNLVSIADTVNALAVSTKTVRRDIAEGPLEAVQIGRKTLKIKVDSIGRFIDVGRLGTGVECGSAKSRQARPISRGRRSRSERGC